MHGPDAEFWEVHRLGFGAMRITGPGIWGPPADRVEAIRTLKRVPELGMNFIDTADSYGPDVSEQLIHEALYPYDGILIATKAGLRRSNADLALLQPHLEPVELEVRKVLELPKEQLGPGRLECNVQIVKLFRLKVGGEVAKRHRLYSSFRRERG